MYFREEMIWRDYCALKIYTKCQLNVHKTLFQMLIIKNKINVLCENICETTFNHIYKDLY